MSGGLTVNQPSQSGRVEPNAFSYADPADPLWKRLVICVIERATGRDILRRLYLAKRREGWGPRGFFEDAISALRLDLRYDAARLAAIPKAGPLLVVANHPYGVLDGVVICALMERVRPDFRVLTNAVLLRAPETRAKLLPIDFNDTPVARRANVATRAAALKFIAGGGCVVIFPAGAVSTSPDRWGRQPAADGPWTPYLARLALAGRGPVLPIYFRGQNSRLFQIASHIGMTFRLALFFHEVRRRMGTAFPVEIGESIPFDALATFPERRDMVEFLRARTMALGEI